MRYQVLDLSYWNKKWNFETAKSRGIHGAILKAGQRSADPYFAINWPVLQDSGLMAGAYHYFVPSMDAAKQAETFYEQIKDGRLELGAWLDLEYNAKIDGDAQNPAKIKDYAVRVLTFLVTLSNLGIKPGIYTNVNHSVLYLSKQEVFAEYDLWLSNPQNGNTRTVPNCPKPWWGDSWRGWQFTWTLPAAYYGAPADAIKGLDGSVFRW